MRVVIDTNVLLVSISSKSKYYWLFKSILNEQVQVLVTNDILLEYHEILSKKLGTKVAQLVENVLLFSNNVLKIDVFYNWSLIQNDPDDNKFVDCAVAGAADYIISNDNHFKILDKIAFPKVQVLTIQEFLHVFENK